MLCIELQLGLALPGHHHGDHHRYSRLTCKGDSDLKTDDPKCAESKTNNNNNKRGFDDAFGDNSVAGNNLLVWHGQPDDDGDDKGHSSSKTSCPINIDNDKDNYIIGWPPIKTSRKKELLQHHGGRQIKKRPTARIRVNPASSSSSSSSTATNNSISSTYVKVKMEGFGIARKVDLSLHRSYHSLKLSLVAMFSNYDQEFSGKDIETYALAYQDKEGDWLLAGDVPWKSFVKSVQRLEVVMKK